MQDIVPTYKDIEQMVRKMKNVSDNLVCLDHY